MSYLVIPMFFFLPSTVTGNGAGGGRKEHEQELLHRLRLIAKSCTFKFF